MERRPETKSDSNGTAFGSTVARLRAPQPQPYLAKVEFSLRFLQSHKLLT